ncbi:MoxR family ATPase [Sporolactobacillus sp. THM7-4]|nr:MoxR family ATPase [Sporolactobacillus sp. THM7-4]
MKNKAEHQLITEMIDHVETVVIGKRKVIKLITVALLAGGHVLIEDIPGVGKTLLVRAIAQSIGAEFKRIQFTPDLLPSDLTGVSIYNQKNARFEFRPGPLMGNLILADEINRTSPKTQSALLEAMAEQRITVDGISRALPELFFVMATQNPVEYEGTYVLPEAQLDRFLLKLSMGYPTREDELAIMNQINGPDLLSDSGAVLTVDDVLRLRRRVQSVYVSDSVKNYILDIITATRKHPMIDLGVSPRGTLGLLKAVQALAFVEQRDFAIPDDVKTIAPYVICHRMVMKQEASYANLTAAGVIREIIHHIKVPVPDRESIQ